MIIFWGRQFKIICFILTFLIKFELEFVPNGFIGNEAAMDQVAIDVKQWPLLLTWFNFNPSMDK